MWKKTRGITIIELVMTVGLISIILGVVTIAFTSNSNIMSKIDANSELQLQSEIIQRELTTVLFETKGITEVSYLSGDAKEISSFTADDELFLHQFNIQNKQLIYQKIDKGSNNILIEKVLSSYVESFIISPDDEDQLMKSKKISITVNLVKMKGIKKIEYKIEQTIIFRNF